MAPIIYTYSTKPRLLLSRQPLHSSFENFPFPIHDAEGSSLEIVFSYLSSFSLSSSPADSNRRRRRKIASTSASILFWAKFLPIGTCTTVLRLIVGERPASLTVCRCLLGKDGGEKLPSLQAKPRSQSSKGTRKSVRCCANKNILIPEASIERSAQTMPPKKSARKRGKSSVARGCFFTPVPSGTVLIYRHRPKAQK